jgi:hypothetical protein
MVAAVRKFISGLFGTYAVSQPQTPTPAPAADHAGERHFSRDPESHTFVEDTGPQAEPGPVAQSTAPDDETHFSANPEEHTWQRSAGPHIATDLAAQHPTATRERDM